MNVINTLITVLLIQLLTASVVPEERSAHSPTLSRWYSAYNNLAEEGLVSPGLSIIGPLPGNDQVDKKHKNRHRDTIIYIPNNINLEKPVDIILFFHGLGGFGERDFKTRILRHTKLFEQLQANYIIIIPEMPWSMNTTTPRSRQGRVFLKSNQFSDLFNASIQKVCRTFYISHSKFKIGSAILIGHSAGGSTLKAISKSGSLDWLTSKAASLKVVFSDAGYGSWTSTTWKNFKSRDLSNTQFIFLTRRWDRPYNNTMRFLKRFKNIPNNVFHEIFERKEFSHTRIGDQALTWAYRRPTCNHGGCRQ